MCMMNGNVHDASGWCMCMMHCIGTANVSNLFRFRIGFKNDNRHSLALGDVGIPEVSLMVIHVHLGIICNCVCMYASTCVHD